MKFDRDEWKIWLSESVSETLEAMAFVEVEPSPVCVWSPALVQCRISVLSPFASELFLGLSRDLAVSLTCAAAGVEASEVDEAFVSDTVGELLNTIVGRFMNKIVAGETDFRLGLPQFEVVPLPHCSLEISFAIDGQPLCLAVAGEFGV